VPWSLGKRKEEFPFLSQSVGAATFAAGAELEWQAENERVAGAGGSGNAPSIWATACAAATVQ